MRVKKSKTTTTHDYFVMSRFNEHRVYERTDNVDASKRLVATCDEESDAAIIADLLNDLAGHVIRKVA